MLLSNGQLPLFAAAATRNIAVTTEIANAIRQNSPVAIGVSGGKDSVATGFRMVEYLDSVKHNGPRVLIHSHLGRIEWQKSLPACERLAERLGLELIVIRRKSGDLIDGGASVG
jgi:tRNA(Ile)-lysidine synthase TilS/MesJ